MTKASAHEELLWDRWMQHARHRPDAEAIVHLALEAAPVRLTFRDLTEQAAGVAAQLAAAGVKPKEVCALMFKHRAELYPLYLGVCALGAVPAILAYPNARLHPDKLLQGLTGMAARSGLDWLLTEESLEPMVRPMLQPSLAPHLEAQRGSLRGILLPLSWGKERADPAAIRTHGVPSEPCLLQHSSGTTGLQKAVLLSHRAVLGHIARYAEAIALGAQDKVVSWLPLYHDMGLITALHLPLANGLTSVHLDPFEWVQAPELLIQALWQEHGTLSWLPNFGYNLLVDRVRLDELDGARLDHVRLFVNCSEPVRALSHQRFVDKFAAIGLSPGAVSACYAMAETTFAASQTRPGTRARELSVSRDALEQHRVVLARDPEQGRVCVSSGLAIPGCRIEVRDASGSVLGEGQVGELWVQSESMFDGYRNAASETEQALVAGWYRTGDLGFTWEGEVYVSGRKKDLIIHAGKNLYPEDIEDAINKVTGVTPGRVVAFGIDDETSGTEHVHVIAETALTELEAIKQLRLSVLRAGMSIDVTLAGVHFAAPRWLIKSSSGKLSRSANRQRLLNGELKKMGGFG